MNKTKEMVLRVCILLGICSITLGVNSMTHKNNKYNEDKLTYIKKIEKTNLTPVATLNSFDMFMEIVNENRLRLIKEEANKEKERLKKLIKTEANKEKVDIKVSASRGGEVEYDTTFICSFYSGLVRENSKYGAVTHKGIKLFDGIVANNQLPYGTKIRLQGWGTVEVLDIGGGNFDSPNRLDIYVPRNKGESEDNYYRRVQKMGKIKVQGVIIQ